MFSRISENLKNGYTTFADATHINCAGRSKLLRNVEGYENVNVVVIQNPISVTLERNEQRKGTRAYVPRSVIRRMDTQFEFPTHAEGFKTIYRVVSDKEPIQIIKSYEEVEI